MRQCNRLYRDRPTALREEWQIVVNENDITKDEIHGDEKYRKSMTQRIRSKKL